MSASAAPPSVEQHEAVSTTPAPQARSESRRTWLRPRRLIALALLVALVAIGLPNLLGWIDFRRTHSITDDAFVEAHIVNVAPEIVSGRIIRFLADENDQVSQGQVVAEVDPTPYRDKVNLARTQLDTARAELARQRADLDRVRKEVPIQIEIAKRTAAAAVADRGRAEESLKYTADEVEKSIDEAPRWSQGGAGLIDARRARIRAIHEARAARGEHDPAAAAGDPGTRLRERAG